MLTFYGLGDNIKIKYKEYPKIVEGKPENAEPNFFGQKKIFPPENRRSNSTAGSVCGKT